MGLLFHFLSSFLVLSSVCAAAPETRVLARGEYGALHHGAYTELHNVMLNPRGTRNNLYIRGAVPYPRSGHHGNRPQKRKVDTSPFLDVRRVLLGARQTCQSGYSLCQCE